MWRTRMGGERRGRGKGKGKGKGKGGRSLAGKGGIASFIFFPFHLFPLFFLFLFTELLKRFTRDFRLFFC